MSASPRSSTSEMAGFVVGSKWGFTKEGFTYIIKVCSEKFQQKLSMAVSLTYSEATHTFHGQCTLKESDAAFRIVTTCITTLFSEVLGRGEDYDDEDVDDERIFKIEAIDTSDEQLQSLEKKVDGLNSRATWAYYDYTKYYITRDKFGENALTPRVLSLIGRLTGCNIHHDQKLYTVAIGGPSEQACHRAINKLDNVRTFWYPQFYHNGNVFFTEDSEKYCTPSINRYVSDNKLFTTTLFDMRGLTVHPCAFLSKAASLGLGYWADGEYQKGEYIAIKRQNWVPAVSETLKESLSKVWGAKFRYMPKGNKANDPLRYVLPKDLHVKFRFDSTGRSDRWHRPKEELERWIDEVEDENLMDAQITEMPSYPRSEATNTSSSLSSTYYDRSRRNVFQNALIDTAASFNQPDHARVSNPRPTTAGDRGLNQLQNALDLLDLIEEDSLPIPIKALVPEKVSGAIGIKKLANQNQPIATKPITNRRDERKGPDLGFQKNDEKLIASFKEGCSKVLEIMRGWDSNLEFKAQFGRIWMDDCPTKAKVGTLTYPPARVDSMLLNWDKGDVPCTKMTEVVTLIPADVQYLVDLPLLNKQGFWKEGSLPWSITYEFVCTEMGDDGPFGEPFLIQIDAELGEWKVKSTPHIIGNVWVHCLNRQWDFRLSGTGSQDLSQKYGNYAAQIYDSMYIPPGKGDDNFYMHFALDASNTIGFLKSHILRKTRYQSVDGRSILTTTEVVDLDIEKHQVDQPKVLNVFELWVRQSKNPENLNELRWHEVDITSTATEEYFSENRSMEFGEVAGWTVADIIDAGVLPSIYEPSCSMITGMDGVGYYNDNGNGERARKIEKKKLEDEQKALKLEKAKSGTTRYW